MIFIGLKSNMQISFVKVESYTEHTTTYIRKKDTHNQVSVLYFVIYFRSNLIPFLVLVYIYSMYFVKAPLISYNLYH